MRLLSWHGLIGSIPVDQSLDNGHLGLFELLLGVTTSSMREINGMVDLDIVVEGDILYFDSGTRFSAVYDKLSSFAGRTHESPTFRRA